MKRCLMTVLVFGGLVSSVWACELSSKQLDHIEGFCFSYSNLAATYCLGAGGEYSCRKNYVKARELYKRACDLGSVNGDSISSKYACFNLGLLYYKGEGVKQDYKKTSELWNKACDMNDAKGCYNLGVLYAKGKGVKQDSNKAKELYSKACDLGNQEGCDNIKKLN